MFYLFIAPVASALVNKYGCRPVGMAGAVAAATAFIVSTFSQSIEVMILTMGVCGGKSHCIIHITRRKFSLELRFCYFANGRYAECKFPI